MFYFLFWHPIYARTTRYEEAFLLKGKKRPHYNHFTCHAWNSNQSNRVDKTGLTNFYYSAAPTTHTCVYFSAAYSCNCINNNSSCFPSTKLIPLITTYNTLNCEYYYSTRHRMQPTIEAAGRQSGPPRSALVYTFTSESVDAIFLCIRMGPPLTISL